jgi:chorismate lyase / 3-hydroxybenzoate synthase
MSHLQLDVVAMEELDRWQQARLSVPGSRRVLGAALYGQHVQPWPAALSKQAWPQMTLPVLGHDTAAWAEIWTVPPDAPAVQYGQLADVHHACSGDLMFAWLNTPLSSSDADLEPVSSRAYAALFIAMQTLGYPHPLRFWNYLPDILGATQGEERYRIFNRGRHAAFVQHTTGIESSPPAACALGHPPGQGAPLTVYVIASKHPGQPIENPRQTSAYRYPPQYGKQSPTFSRATVAGSGPDATLFISGTASIVGHETVHINDVRAQTAETLRNIEALLDQVHTRCPGLNWSLPDLQLKTYVRDAADLPAVREVIEQHRGSGLACQYLQATVCRPDLLVEIEACATACDALSRNQSTIAIA